MVDEPGDVRSDSLFYILQGDDGNWRLIDTEEETAKFPSLPEARAYVYGLWDGMTAVTGEAPNLACAVYTSCGLMVDTLVPLTRT